MTRFENQFAKQLLSISFIVSASWTSQAALPTNLSAAAKSILDSVSSPKLTAQNCSPALKALVNDIYIVKPNEHFPEVRSAKTLDEFVKATNLIGSSPDNPVTKLFEARVKLSERLRKWVATEQFEIKADLDVCANAVRTAIGAIRSMDEFWSLMLLHRQKSNGKTAAPPTRLKSQWPSAHVNPAHASFKGREDLRTGDILLTRGPAFSSAVIARIGSIENQFSHLSIVLDDTDGSLAQKVRDMEIRESGQSKIVVKPGQKFLVESVLERGVQVGLLDDFLDSHKFARINVYRLKQVNPVAKISSVETIARQAAEAIFERRVRGGPICYNFSMNIDDDSCLFCSQTIAWALEQSCSSNVCEIFSRYQSTHKKKFPLIYTPFNSQGNQLSQTLGISVTESFAPGDAEIDPRLEIVTEWRDLENLPVARVHDMVLSKVFQWMEKGGYNFKLMPGVEALSKLGSVMIRQLGKMPANTPDGFIKGTILIYFLVEWDPRQVPVLGQSILSALPDQVPITAPSGNTTMVSNDAKKLLEQLMQVMALGPRLLRFEKESALDSEKYGKFYLSEERLETLLERIRVEDCKKLQAGQPTEFHHFFAKNFGDATNACSQQPMKLRGI